MSNIIVKPTVIKAKIELSNKENIIVSSDAVDNTGQYSSSGTIIKGLKKAAKEEIFPPLISSQNG